MKKYKAFTLVELLVVISVISLLMAIMMPALGKVRRRAMNVLDQMNLKQWSTMIMMYADDYEGSTPMGWTESPPYEVKGMWMTSLRPYYDIGEIRCCPTANKKFRSDDPSPVDVTFVAWGIWGEGLLSKAIPGWADEGDYGSYGINGWIHNPPDSLLQSWGALDRKSKYWRTFNVKNGNIIPMFGDCEWDGTAPDPKTNPPPQYRGQGGNKQNPMPSFAMLRHDNKINLTFMDMSVRNVKIKELWEFKWHREAEPAIHPWPEWIEELD